MRNLIIFILFMTWNTACLAEIKPTLDSEEKSYIVINKGKKTYINYSKKDIYDMNGYKLNGKMLKSYAILSDNPQYVVINYKCLSHESYSNNTKYKQETITLDFSEDVAKKLNFKSGNDYFVTFKNNKGEHTASGTSNLLGSATSSLLAFKVVDSEEIRKLFQNGGDLIVLVRNTTQKIPEIKVNFNGFKEGYSLIKDCIEFK